MAISLSASARNFAMAAGMIGVICFIALLSAVVIALYPLTFSLGLIGLTGMLVLALTAAIMSSDVKVPGNFLRTLLAAVLMVSALWPGYILYKFGSAPGINPTRVLYWGTAAIWGFWMMASPDMRKRLFERVGLFKLLHTILAAYVVWQLVACTFSPNPFASFYFLVKLLFGACVFYFIALTALRDSNDVERLVLAIVLAAAAVSLVGVAENFRKANLFAGLFPTDPEQLETLQWIILDKSRSGAYRVASTFSHPLALAEYLTMCLPLAAYLSLNGQTLWRRWLGLASVPLLLVAIYLSHTRSALICAAVVVVVLTLVAGLRAATQTQSFLRATVGAFTIVGVVLASAGGVGILTDLTLGRDAAERGSTNARVYMLSLGTRLAQEEPITGYGPGRAASTLGALPGHVNITIDNYYLSAALESGLPGLLLFFLSLAYPISLGFYRGITHPGRSGWLALAIAAGLLAYAIERGVLSLVNNLQLSLLLTAMLLVVELHIRSERNATRPARARALLHA